MEIKEAINWFEEELKDGKCSDECIQCNAYEEALKALKRQTPKTPLIWENNTTPNDDWGYECPCCGNQEIDYPEHHCVCGQALQWDDYINIKTKL